MKIETLITEKSSKARDPYVLYFNEQYYYCFSRDDKIYLSVAKELGDLNNEKETIVYQNEEKLKNLWAPELHIIENKCYIYVAGDDGNNENHRMYVLFNDSNNPLKEYTNSGIIAGMPDKWAIDGTILNYQKDLYFIWSGCEGNIHYKQELFISKMKNPFEVYGPKVLISSPEYYWEKRGGDGKNLAFVNEGPAVLYIDDKIFLGYSASGCWCRDYCIGLLELIGDNPLAKTSWKKYDKPIFSSKENIIGPGHCSFTIKNDNDNCKHYMIFHSFNDENDLNLQNVNARYVQIKLIDDELVIDYKK